MAAISMEPDNQRNLVNARFLRTLIACLLERFAYPLYKNIHAALDYSSSRSYSSSLHMD
jgi:hypothetical protein